MMSSACGLYNGCRSKSDGSAICAAAGWMWRLNSVEAESHHSQAMVCCSVLLPLQMTPPSRER